MALRGSRHRPREQDGGVLLKTPSDRALLLLVAVLAAAGILPFALVHVDDVDAAVYTVVARHLAQDGTPLHLRFLAARWPSFFEHPPLFFWIQALAVRLASERALPWLGAAVGVATALVTFTAGKRLLGARAAFLGAFVLCATEQFYRYQARARLDPPLALAYTASVALLLAAEGRTALYALGGLAAGLGALVKGPPALGAPLSAALALVALGRARELRSARAWAAAAGCAALPPLLFLAYDHFALGGAWWQSYVRGQVLASLTGGRVEGVASHWRPLQVIARGFWPGVPFAALALAAAVIRPRHPLARPRLALAAWASVILLGFAAATRIYWWYLTPAFMPLALLAGSGLDALIQRAAPARGFPVAARAIGALGVAALAAVPFWPERRLVAPCPFGDLPARAAALAPPGHLVGLVVAEGLGEPAMVAQHTGRDVLDARTPGEIAARGDVGVALLQRGAAVPAGFELVAAHGPWRLARRVPPTIAPAAAR